MQKADYWILEKGSDIRCLLCPRGCLICDGKRGFCSVRYNVGGELYSLAYGHPVALQIDPIEKKPFAEFMRGTRTFSIGTYGCNLDCSFCQNYHLSRGRPSIENMENERFVPPELLVDETIKHNCQSIAFTYNEPTVWMEYAFDIASVAKSRGLPAVLVSNGFISEKPANEFYPLISAANIDMKGFSELFYEGMTRGSLAPVLNSIKLLYDLKVHVEITNLVIPGRNDDISMIDDFLTWAEKNLDREVPLHFSAFFPTHRLLNV